MSGRFAIKPLAKAHNWTDFTCGNERIDSYFRETVSQDVKRKYATCFVAKEVATAAFYESFGFQPLPESLRLVLSMRSIEELLVR